MNASAAALRLYRTRVIEICDALLRAIGSLPLGWRRKIGRLTGRVIHLFPTRDRRIGACQMDAFIPEAGGSRLLPAVYSAMGETLLECLNLEPMLERPSEFIECPDLEFLREFSRRHRSFLAVSAHTGNWELLAAYTVKQGIRLRAVGRVAKHWLWQELLARIRERAGVETLWREGSSAADVRLKDLFSSVEGAVAALVDQDTRVSSVPAPFFGVCAWTPKTLFTLARRAGAGVLSAFIFRTENGRFLVRFEEIDSRLSAEEMAAEFNRRLECYVRCYPSQWVWFHKRWRRRPDGTRMSSREYLGYLEAHAKNV